MEKKETRIHSLDSLRAYMMLLGIVLHATEVYLVGDNPPFPKDFDSTHLGLNYVEYLIHMFRMPIFFLLAGFFGALLYTKRGISNMIQNRIRRIVYPFITFLIVLFPVVAVSIRSVTGLFSDGLTSVSFSTEDFIPDSTIHLWFLYYLWLCTLLTLFLAKILTHLKGVKNAVLKIFRKVVYQGHTRLGVSTLLIFILLLIIWELSPPVPLTLIPDFPSLAFYLFFYLFGWLLFKTKELLPRLVQNAGLYTLLAVAVYSIEFLFYNEIDDVIKGIMSAFVIALFLSGIPGLFIQHYNGASKRMRYISDSSYWVYLIHLPFTIIIPAFLIDWEVSGIIKFLINLTLTSLICFISYHFLVRKTVIGEFLNGKKY
ncbi:MAG: acyltransferase family protein [Ekhidna sp.]